METGADLGKHWSSRCLASFAVLNKEAIRLANTELQIKDGILLCT